MQVPSTSQPDAGASCQPHQDSGQPQLCDGEHYETTQLQPLPTTMSLRGLPVIREQGQISHSQLQQETLNPSLHNLEPTFSLHGSSVVWNPQSPSRHSVVSTGLASNPGAYEAGSRLVSCTILSEEILDGPPPDLGVRYVQVSVPIQEVVKRVPRRELVDVEKIVPVYDIEYVERIVEVPEIQYLDRIKEVDVVEDVIVYKPVKQVVDRQREVITTVPKIVYVPTDGTQEFVAESGSVEVLQRQASLFSHRSKGQRPKVAKRRPGCCVCSS